MQWVGRERLTLEEWARRTGPGALPKEASVAPKDDSVCFLRRGRSSQPWYQPPRSAPRCNCRWT